MEFFSKNTSNPQFLEVSCFLLPFGWPKGEIRPDLRLPWRRIFESNTDFEAIAEAIDAVAEVIDCIKLQYSNIHLNKEGVYIWVCYHRTYGR